MRSSITSNSAALTPAISRRGVLRILTIGFGLVILLLAAAAWSNLQRSRAIQEEADQLMRQNQVTDRLMDGLEREQIAAVGLLVRLSRLDATTGQPSRETIQALENDFLKLQSSVSALADQGRAASPASAWDQLTTAADAYASLARTLLHAPRTIHGIANLEDRQQQLLHLAGRIEKEDAARSILAEQNIRRQSLELEHDSIWLLGACLVLALCFALLTIWFANLSWRRMENQSDELSRVSWHMLRGQEESARRFSHEMHDEFGQSLTGLRAVLMGLKPGEFEARRRECIHLLDVAISNVRELSQLLRPVILDDFGLDAGLRWLVEGFGQRTRITANYHSNFAGRLSEDTETHLFRIAQEALTNIARHSGATEVSVTLRLSAAQATLTIEDNGRGLSRPERGSNGLGLVGMRARARQLHGEMQIGQADRGGVRVQVSVPRKDPQPEAPAELVQASR